MKWVFWRYCFYFAVAFFFFLQCEKKIETYFYDPFIFLIYFNGWSERENGTMTDEIGGGLFFSFFFFFT